MNGSIIREICLLSVLFGAALSIAPEGSVKTMMGILCSLILLSVLIKPFTEMDIEAYALNFAKYSMLESEIEENSLEMRQSLDRFVIEEKYEAYIMDKAQKLSIELVDVGVQLKWLDEGYWIPWTAELRTLSDITECMKLAEALEAELGISRERQMWSTFE